MALMINDAHIIYYQTNSVRAPLLEHSYCQSPDYLAAKAWIWAMFLLPDTVVLTGPLVYRYEKSFQGWRGIPLMGFHISIV